MYSPFTSLMTPGEVAFMQAGADEGRVVLAVTERFIEVFEEVPAMRALAESKAAEVRQTRWAYGPLSPRSAAHEIGHRIQHALVYEAMGAERVAWDVFQGLLDLVSWVHIGEFYRRRYDAGQPVYIAPEEGEDDY